MGVRRVAISGWSQVERFHTDARPSEVDQDDASTQWNRRMFVSTVCTLLRCIITAVMANLQTIAF